MQGRGRGREELEREPSFSFGVNDPYSLQTRLDMEAIGDTGRTSRVNDSLHRPSLQAASMYMSHSVLAYTQPIL